MPTPPANQPTPWRSWRRFAFPVLWLLVITFFVTLREVAAPFIGAVLIAYLLAPLVTRLAAIRLRAGGRQFRCPRWIAVIGLYLLLGLVVWGYGALAVPRIGAEFGKLAHEGEKFLQSLTPERIEEYSQGVKTWFESRGLPVKVVTPGMSPGDESPQGGFVLRLDEIMGDSMGELAQGMRRALVNILKLGPQFAARLFRSVLMAFLILMVAAFFMLDPQRLIGFFRSLFPPRLHQGYQEVLREIDIGLSGVVRGQVIICLVNGLLTFVGLMLLGVKFPVLLSSLAAVMSLVPIFGSVLSSIPIVAVALTSGFTLALGALAWIIGVHLLEANLLNPKIIGDAARIHPALVVFVLLAGEHFRGIVGALFAVPLTAVGLALFKVLHRRALRWGDNSSQEPAQDASAPARPVAVSDEVGGHGPGSTE